MSHEPRTAPGGGRATTALVIGGGIAGPATAMALQKAGIEPTVFEAHPTGADGVGAFLTLASNGLDALRILEADGPARSLGFPTPGITLRSGTGKRLGESGTGGAASLTLKRSDLYRAMSDEARARGIEIHHGRRLTAAHDAGGQVHAVFADGGTEDANLLIGADGVHSTVRTIIDPAAPAPAYGGLIGTGGYATDVQVDAEPGSYEMIFGRRGFFGYASPRDGEVWWFANVPHREPPTDPGETDWRPVLLDLFADDAGPATALIEATPDLLPASPIHSIPHLPHWHRDTLVVVGDAAHAPSPTSGQGASLAVEDAVELARCLRDLPDHTQAFARFEHTRRARVERIIKAAARINNSKAAGPVGRVVRDAMLPAILRLTADTKAYRETHGYRIDWNASAA